jgi:hypothetical protein
MPASGASRSNPHDRDWSAKKLCRQQADGYCRGNGKTERRIETSSGDDVLVSCWLVVVNVDNEVVIG